MRKRDKVAPAAKALVAVGLGAAGISNNALAWDPWGPCRSWYGACQPNAPCGGETGGGYRWCCVQIEGEMCSCLEVLTTQCS